jgi:large conductance mechanosensitive channel
VIKEFKEFLMKGNLLEIAIGLILALAFKAIVDSIVADILTPIIAAVFGQPSFQSLTLDIGDGEIKYGITLNALFSFIVIGLVLFVVMKAYNSMQRKGPEEEVTDEEILLLREIRDSLRAGR